MTGCSSALLESPKALFSSKLIISGSADRCQDEKAPVCLYFCAGGVQRQQASRFAYFTYISYCTYSVYSTYSAFLYINIILIAYSAYSVYSGLIVYRMGGCLPVNHSLRAPRISWSLVCYSSFLHTGAASSGPGGQYWNDPLPDARGIGWLSRRKLW